MSRAQEDKAFQELTPYLHSEGVKRLRDYIEARIETHRSILEQEDSALTRGQCKEDRHFLKILSE